MSTTVTRLTAGPGILFTGAFGATEPASSAVNATYAGSAFTDVGGTQDGVNITVNQEFFKLTVDQLVDVPGRRMTERDVQVSTNMAEPTLTNLELALNGGTVTASASYEEYEPDDDIAATQPTYKALLLEGYSGAYRRWLIVRKVLSIENVGTSYKKDGMTLYPVTFGAHYVSSAIKPFKLIDQTA